MQIVPRHAMPVVEGALFRVIQCVVINFIRLSLQIQLIPLTKFKVYLVYVR